jgi:flagellar biosynthesis protein FlhG
MLRVLPIASGKGGVGKSVLAANLGAALASLGKTVVLIDLDLGASNLHTCLGIRNSTPGLGSLLWRHEKSLESLLVETGIERLWLVPGDNLLPAAANLEWHAKNRLLRDLPRLPADFVILDLGAGTSFNVVDFFVAAPAPLLVLAPEITSVLNAYSLLKNAAYRILQRSLPEKSAERLELQAFAGTRLEGSGVSFLEFARGLAERSPELGGPALARLRQFCPGVVLNRGHDAEDARLGQRLGELAQRNLGMALGFEAFLLEDHLLPRSVGAREPLVVSTPESAFSRGVLGLARRILAAEGGAAETVPTAMGTRAPAGSRVPGELGRLAEEALAFQRGS